MPYRLTHFSPGRVRLEVTGHIDFADVEAMREESALSQRHLVEPFDAVIDASAVTGVNPLALLEMRGLPMPRQLRAVAVILGGVQLLAAKVIPSVDGLFFVGSLEEAEEALVDAPPLDLPRDEGPASSVDDAAPLPRVRRLPTGPLPAAHRGDA